MQILPILKALGPLIVNAGGIAAGLRSSGSTARIEDRVARLEQETLRVSEVLTGLAQQLQAVAEELRVQAEQTAALRKKAMVALGLAAIALCAGLGAVAVTLWR